MPSIRSHGQTDVGRVRKLNEDAFLVDDELGLYVVADGMGGHAAGEVASEVALDEILGMVKNRRAVLDTFRAEPDEQTAEGVRRMLESAVQAATYMVFGIAQFEPSHQGMGTTSSSLIIAGNHAFVAQVGDSRVYQCRSGVVAQITDDHTLVNMQLKAGVITAEEAKTSRYQNVITRAVGIKDHVEVDTFHLGILPDDRFLLCSDGLTGYINDPHELAQLMQIPDLQAATAALIDLANNRGGKDNITVILLEVAAD
jgi:serine/threonine protein phosphatase PrpC